MRFPEGFQWGVATAAAQIEGAPLADGKGESIWDRFAARGRVQGGPDVLATACDHYRRWAEDVEILAEMGVGVYRFSVSWPRLFPSGTGALNQRGLDFYRRLVEALNHRGIRPALTLYHWDLPQALQEKGGWLNRDTAARFAEYAAALFRALGAEVPIWMTLNEPFIVTFLGHMTGEHAPGIRRPFSAMQAAHHLLLAHGEAVRAFRQTAPAGARIGLTNFLWINDPASDRPADQAAAHRVDGMMNRWFLDPVLKGHYPEDIWRWYGRRFALPRVRSGDLETISQPIDFLGVQYYSRVLHRANPWDLFTGAAQVEPPPGAPVTQMGWECYPEGLYRLLRRLDQEYGKIPLIVTENGAAYEDRLTPDGRVDDPERIRYLREHIDAVGRAIADGVKVEGYYVWTLLDNVEWHHGVSKRFGLIYVDFPTQRRIWKESARWYRTLIGGHKPGS
ncbi:MAG: GH1 family beta-glucosidase [Bacillota bacterium]